MAEKFGKEITKEFEKERMENRVVKSGANTDPEKNFYEAETPASPWVANLLNLLEKAPNRREFRRIAKE